MGMGTTAIWLCICSVILTCASIHAQTKLNLTLLDSAVPKGAVCLDGSAPSYFYAEGSGNGSNSWIIYLEGGGWCDTIDDCRTRSLEPRGSSLHFPNQTYFAGLLDLDYSFNPYFYNWHKVFIHYCDGASFMADIEHPVSNLSFRGARIFKVMMEEMLSKGMENAQNAILTGTSAGGLATTLHCDRFSALFPHTTRVKCISDSGFFIHGEGLPGADGRAQYYAQVIATHELKKSLPKSCTQKIDPNLCLFPENFVGDIKTPVFLLESAFDTFQIKYSLVPAVGGKRAWINCLENLASCNSTELEIMRDFRAVFIETLLKLDHSSSRGMFVHSCFRHGHVIVRDGWTCSFVFGNNVLANNTIEQAVRNWYLDGSPFQMIDTQNDVPRDCNFSSKDILNQRCLATRSFESIASNQLIMSKLCIVMQIMVMYLCY